MSRLTSPMNREKRCEKQRCFIRAPSLSVWPDVGQTGGEKDTFHTRRAMNKRCMGQPPLTDALHTPCRRTGQQRTFVETVEEGGVTGSGDLATFCLPCELEKDRLF